MAWTSSVLQNVWKYRRAAFLGFIFLVLLFYNCLGLLVPTTLESFKLYENLPPEKIDELQTCQLPLHHPFEPEGMAYFKAPYPVRCRASLPMLTFVDTQGFLRFNLTAFNEAGYSLDSLTCKYQNIWRGPDDSQITYSAEKLITGEHKPESDFFFVGCSKFSWLPNVYTMFHASVQQDPQVREFEDDEELGVVVVGLDSVSRLNFMRQLPRAYIALTQILGAVVFKGFNKVGHNTFPNLVPILMGSPANKTSDSTTFDDWPLLWKFLKADGVATMYGEDLSTISTFNYWGAGFKNSPTNHYFRRYWVAVDQSRMSAISSSLCLGPIPKHRIFLDYILSFLRTYKKSPQFLFSLENEPSHDYLNTVGVMDKDLERFLLTAYGEGLLNRTILLVLADHGNRIDDFRQTHLGKLEDFMPMVSMVVPPWLAKKHPDLMDNLTLNSKRLTSSYDLYSTFTDIFNRYSFKKTKPKYNFSRPIYGQSLFQPVPITRTCADAGIPDIYCICKEDSKPLERNDPLVQQSLRIIFDYMNNQILNSSSILWQSTLEKYSKAMQAQNRSSTVTASVVNEKCSRLRLVAVEKAELFNKADGNKIVLLKYRTSPNDGLYEGRVRWDVHGSGVIHEEITRANRYGTQPDCLGKELLIIVPFVRSACYCF